VHTLSIGASRPTDFDEHVRALPLLADAKTHLEPVLDRLAGAMEEAVGDRDPEAIVRGLPPWERTPNHYNLPVILWLRNLALGWGLTDYARWRFNMLTESGHWFAGNRPRSVDEVDVDELLASVCDHPRRQEIPGLLSDAVQQLSSEPERRLSEGGR
jgi:predicted aldo/keto reductase-like oxidoreductase